MRPHGLRVTAFGAFGGTVQVNFDDLAAAGLFLLHGETGAGKTTLLDAIGFALYGRVPGVRGDAKRLRSDHADAGDANRGGAGGDDRWPARADHPPAGTDTAQEAR